MSSANYTVTTGFYGGSDNTGPIITPIPLPVDPPLGEGSTIDLTFVVEDVGSGVESVEMKNAQGGGGLPSNGQECDQISDTTWRCSIDGGTVGTAGVKYQIIATDGSNGNVSRFPDNNQGADLPILTEGKPFAIRASTTTYQVISAPFDLVSRSITTLIPEITTDISEWRLFELKPNYVDVCTPDNPIECYNEYPSFTSIGQGRSYLIISREGGSIETGRGTTVSTVDPFASISLNPGWNMIGNPYDFPIPVSNFSLRNSDEQPDVRNFNGGNASSMAAFGGVIVDGGQGGGALEIDPNPVSNKREPSPAPNKTNQTDYAPEWAIEIEAESDELVESGNLAGIHSEAKEAWDKYDSPEPLYFGDYLSVYFPHEEWGRAHRVYESDIRKEIGTGATWDFKLASAESRNTTLRFKGLEDVPPHYSVQLIDITNKRTQDLRTRDEYSLHSAGIGSSLPFQLIIGEADYVAEVLEDIQIVPEKFELDQNYPNPFNPTTTIRYGVTEDAIVTLQVYNVLGQVVATLVNGETRSSGYHTAVWEAVGLDGRPAASGVYVYRLEVTPVQGAEGSGTVLTKKMMLLK